MSDRGYDIDFDEQHNILRIRLYGLWDGLLLARFAATVPIKSAALKIRGRTFDVLVDTTDFPVQSPRLGEGFQKILALARTTNTGFTAIIVSSMLSKLQIERVLHHERLRAFLDPAEAKAWLVEKRAAVPRR